ncbi:MAG: hypothetical protein RIS64_1963 [Bacteroidota bacterium]|jgi:hypothetical protein
MQIYNNILYFEQNFTQKKKKVMNKCKFIIISCIFEQNCKILFKNTSLQFL